MKGSKGLHNMMLAASNDVSEGNFIHDDLIHLITKDLDFNILQMLVGHFLASQGYLGVLN